MASYPQYPPYSYPNNPYSQSPYPQAPYPPPYPPPNQQQHSQQQQHPSYSSAFGQPNTVPTQQHGLPQPGPATQPRPSTQTQQQRTSAQASSIRRNGALDGSIPISLDNDSAPTGPGAPPPESNSPDLEDQLRHALQRDNQTDNEHDDQDAGGDDNEDNDVEDANEPVFNLPPPPEGNYPGEEELEKSLHAWSLEQGYEMVRRASKKNAGGTIYKRYYHCSKHGRLANTGKLTDSARVRTRRKSNRIGCPMSLAAVAVDPSNPAGQWQIRHRKTHHNHGPLDALALAGHRRRARMGGVEKAVDGLFAIGTPTTQVLQFLQRTNPDGLFTRTDVANMKLKWKKYGTCVHLSGQYAKDAPIVNATGPGAAGATKFACVICRQKKTKCDGKRPTCGTCAGLERACEYDHEPLPPREPQQPVLWQPPPASPGESAGGSGSQGQQATPQSSSNRRGQNQLGMHRAEAEKILADLQTFQEQHLKPKRLGINSSRVEILAHSSCGNGDSYKNVPTLYVVSDWPAYSDAFLEASLKENTHATLIAEKIEPVQPPTQPGQGVESIDVEDWNEYVQQLAIFNRRNGALLGALFGSLAPSFRTRVQGYKRASEAWRSLEEMCSPRGSEQAFKLWNELHNVTLSSCDGNLQKYIGRIEVAHQAFTKVKMGLQVPHGRPRVDGRDGKQISAGTGADVVGEEALCLLFLRGLGEQYGRFVENLTSTNNVAGFGTGFRLGFKEICKRAVEWEMGQLGRSSR